MSRRSPLSVLAALVASLLFASTVLAAGTLFYSNGAFTVYGADKNGTAYIITSGYAGMKVTATGGSTAPTFSNWAGRVWNPATGAALSGWTIPSKGVVTKDGGLLGLFPSWTASMTMSKAVTASGCQYGQTIGLVAWVKVNKDGSYADKGTYATHSRTSDNCIYPYFDPVSTSNW